MAEPETDDVVERAVKSLLDQVPTTPDTSLPMAALQQRQPWADIAATPGTDKKSLEQLVEEFEAKVAADPDATIPPSPLGSPSEAYLERFSRPAQRPGKRRRRRKRGVAGGSSAGAEAGTQRAAGPRPGGPRGSGSRPAGPRAAAQRPGAPRPSEGPRADGSGAPRRRRRRRGGRGRGPAGGGASGASGPPA